jgi:SAM-dependent methyltransferase
MTAHALQSEPGPSSTEPPSQLRPVPGQSSVLPRVRPSSTLALYAACARALEDEQLIWDVGCGEGQGTALLAVGQRTVVGIDPDPNALESALAIAGAGVVFMAEPPRVATPSEAPDLIVVSNVLGYVEQPDLLLLQLCLCAKPSTTLLLWEPRSEPTQQLPANKLRAFSPRELAELAAVAGWQPQEHPALCDSFTSLTATRGPQPVVQTLARLASNLAEAQPLDLTTISPELATAIHLRHARNALHARDGNATTSHLLAALGVSPTHSEALCGLAHLALTCGSVQDALHFLRTCLDSDPTNIGAMQLWVRFLDAAGPKERLAGYQTLANLNPADATGLSTLAQLNAENGDPLLAIQDLERLRRYHPQPSLDLSLTLGWLLHSVGRKSDAEVEARLASLLDPDGPDVMELRAAIAAS